MICVREPLFWVRLACSTNWRKVRLYVYEGQVLSNTWNTPALDNSIFYDEIILSIQMLKSLPTHKTPLMKTNTISMLVAHQ